jgi:prepilin-type N-terminal cleavage/methylation domain-containing protein
VSREMEHFRSRNIQGGFTLIDLLATIAVLSVMAAIILPAVTTFKKKARLKLCTANLQQVGRAIAIYANDNKQKLPAATQGEDIWWWYKEKVKGYVGLKGPSSTNDTVFACPDDRGYSDPKPFYRTPRFDYGSYVFNGVSTPGAPNIAGWELSSIKAPNRTLLVMEFAAHAPLSWHNSKTGKENYPFYCDAQNVVGFVDGHVSFSKIYYDGYTAAYLRDPIPGYEYKYSGN